MDAQFQFVGTLRIGSEASRVRPTLKWCQRTQKGPTRSSTPSPRDGPNRNLKGAKPADLPVLQPTTFELTGAAPASAITDPGAVVDEVDTVRQEVAEIEREPTEFAAPTAAPKAAVPAAKTGRRPTARR